MKITRVETTTVAVPFVPRMEVLNADLAKIPKVIIKVFTDEGLIGVGESYRGISEETVREHSSKIIGKNPLDMNLQELGLPAVLDHVFEQAICDLAGKALKVPVYKLLGGAYRMDVPVSAWSPHHGPRSPEKTAAIAELAAEMGYEIIKLKARSWDIVETVEAIEKAVGPDMGIVCDPNTQFEHLSTAVKIARKLDRYNIVCFEDPIRKENLRSYVLLRQKIDIPIALHIVGVDIINAVKMEACDIINTGGTMYEFKKNAAIAELAGMPVWHGSGVDLGVLEASYVHACAATKNAVLTSDVFSEFCREDDILIEPLEIQNGLTRVPNKPGLGVEIDDKALEKYRVR
ncbi:MAG: mandelate racemase/muconate lactonizing enzyme family protein [Candidatus Bathyarchaeota archaeon]|nr:mandelate racemase/muconate lactonizing enzyme family protein [Candidatus Bathyarchaeota archaeon]